MKIRSVKVYALAVFGLCSAQRYFVLAHYVSLACISDSRSPCSQRGLKINISPAAKPSSTGESTLVVKPHKLYTVTLDIVWDKSSKLITKWEHASTFHAYLSCLRFKNETKLFEHNGLAVESRLKLKVGDNTYYVGWRLRGTALQKWIAMKKIQISTVSTMDLQAFITEYEGVYSFEWRAEGPVLHIGYTGALADTLTFAQNELLGCLTSFGKTVENEQNIVLQLSNEVTQIPAKFYESLVKALTSLGFELQDGRYEGNCDSVRKHIQLKQSERSIYSQVPIENFASPDPLSLHLCLLNYKELLFQPFQYLSKNGEKCTLDIIENSEETWVLGSSFLKAYSVIITTKEKYESYQFMPSETKDWLAPEQAFWLPEAHS